MDLRTSNRYRSAEASRSHCKQVAEPACFQLNELGSPRAESEVSGARRAKAS